MRKAALLLLLAGCSFYPPEFEPLDRVNRIEERRAEVLCESYLSWAWSSFPAEATLAGVHEFDHTLGPQGSKANAARLKALGYYLHELEDIDRQVLPDDLRLDLAAMRMDVGLRRLRLKAAGRSGGVESDRLLDGLLALIDLPGLSERDRARNLAHRLLDMARLIRTVPVYGLDEALERIESWYGSLEDKKLAELGKSALKRIKESSRKKTDRAPPAPVGEDHLTDLISVILTGRPGRLQTTSRLLSEAKDQLSALRAEGGAKAQPVTDVSAEIEKLRRFTETHIAAIPVGQLTIKPDGPGTSLAVTGPFEPVTRATYRGRRSTVMDLAIQLFPGHLLRELYLGGISGGLCRLALQPAISRGYPLAVAEELIRNGYEGTAGDLKAEFLNAQRRSIVRLIGVIEYHTGKLSFEALVEFLKDEALLEADGARNEARRIALEPSIMAEALGAGFLRAMRDASGRTGFWGELLSAGNLPLESLWKKVLSTDPPGNAFIGPAVDPE
jgi:hypothetical protein